MQSAKLRLPTVERSQDLVQLGARRKFEMQGLIQLTFLVGRVPEIGQSWG